MHRFDQMYVERREQKANEANSNVETYPGIHTSNANINSPLRGSEWLKNLEKAKVHALKASSIEGSRESTQISSTSETSEIGLVPNDVNLDDTRMVANFWDSSKKRRKAKKSGFAERWEQMLKNESSDRTLKEHLKEQEGLLGVGTSNDIVPLTARIVNYEVGMDDLVRFRCQRTSRLFEEGDCVTKSVPTSVSSTFEVLLNKDDEIQRTIDTCSNIESIKIYRPFVEVSLNDYAKNDIPSSAQMMITLITNPSRVEVFNLPEHN